MKTLYWHQYHSSLGSTWTPTTTLKPDWSELRVDCARVAIERMGYATRLVEANETPGVKSKLVTGEPTLEERQRVQLWTPTLYRRSGEGDDLRLDDEHPVEK